MRASFFVSAAILGAGAASAAERLREQLLDTSRLGLKLDSPSDIPVDPHGKSGPERSSGYYSLQHTSAAEMFYFFFESRSKPKDDPVVLWMTGGPGCSSELAVFYENGPFHINDDLTLRENKFGWDKSHNMIYVDQPIGTGFSYSTSSEDTVYGEVAVADDMLDFLVDFLKAHPDLADNELYVTGESYAGHYVPAVSHRIWQWNKDGNGPSINFKGFAIGNGLTDPAIQYGAYADFALENKLIGQAVHDRVNSMYPACKTGIETCNGHDWSVICKAALAYCQAAIFGQVLGAAGNINVYDIRKQCEGPLCYDFSLLDKYLAQKDVRSALGVGDREWTECDSTVHADMMGDWMINYAELLPDMLNDGVRALIYAGDQDLICNWLGNRRWVDALDWDDAEKWAAAKDEEWAVDGTAAGLVRQAGSLAFAKVYGAGHMVPMDKGEQALNMLEHLTRDRRFKPAHRDVAQLGAMAVEEIEEDTAALRDSVVDA